MRAIAACLVFALMLGTAVPSNAEPPPPAAQPSPSIGAKILDAVIVKPVYVAQALLGGFVLPVAYLLALFTGDKETIIEIAVLDPLNRARRPLGDF